VGEQFTTVRFGMRRKIPAGGPVVVTFVIPGAFDE
jgi:hypothetical protein